VDALYASVEQRDNPTQGRNPFKGNMRAALGLTCMPKYFFHLAGQIPAHDLIGQECANESEAKDHGTFIAHRIGTEKPEMVREENFISVRDTAIERFFEFRWLRLPSDDKLFGF
jgi:hypothetical protein